MKIKKTNEEKTNELELKLKKMDQTLISGSEIDIILKKLWEETTQVVNNFDTKLFNQLTKKQKAVDNTLKIINTAMSNEKAAQQYKIDDFRFESEKKLREIQLEQLKRQEEEVVKEINYVNINEATPEMIEEIRNITNGEITIHKEMDAEIVEEE